MKARCSGWSLAIVPKPSSVVILLLAAVETGTEQERAGLPSSSTVQAPHWASPQPNFGPFSSRSLRRTYSSGVSGATEDTPRVAPFTRNVKSGMISSGRGLCSWVGDESVHHRGGPEPAQARRRLPAPSLALDGSPPLPRLRAFAADGEHEAGDRPVPPR